MVFRRVFSYHPLFCYSLMVYLKQNVLATLMLILLCITPQLRDWSCRTLNLWPHYFYFFNGTKETLYPLMPLQLNFLTYQLDTAQLNALPFISYCYCYLHFLNCYKSMHRPSSLLPFTFSFYSLIPPSSPLFPLFDSLSNSSPSSMFPLFNSLFNLYHCITFAFELSSTFHFTFWFTFYHPSSYSSYWIWSNYLSNHFTVLYSNIRSRYHKYIHTLLKSHTS